MLTINFVRPGQNIPLKQVVVGCVSSGDLEVMIEPTTTTNTMINIKTSTNGSTVRWQQIIQSIENSGVFPLMKMDINDFGATPGVIRLRIEQAIECARQSIDSESYHE